MIVRRRNRGERVQKVDEIEHGWSEDWVLKLLFFLLLMGAVAAVTYDFQQLTNGALRLPSLPDRLRPATPIALPEPDDQVRRYSPRSMPRYAPGATVDLPGFQGDPERALASAMTFHEGENGSLIAIGRIEVGTFDAFERYLSVTREGENRVAFRTLILHSPGGSVQDAMSMARLVRDLDMATLVPDNGYCASSCPIAFSGGEERTVGSPVWFGVHQVFARETQTGTLQDGIESAQTISSETQRLLSEMGVDPAAWIHAMATPKDALYLFTQDELRRYDWITRGE
ncbi:MAG: hypothetical protein AAGA88_13625 [Pseudomonadota bacterium]